MQCMSFHTNIKKFNSSYLFKWCCFLEKYNYFMFTKINTKYKKQLQRISIKWVLKLKNGSIMCKSPSPDNSNRVQTKEDFSCSKDLLVSRKWKFLSFHTNCIKHGGSIFQMAKEIFLNQFCYPNKRETNNTIGVHWNILYGWEIYVVKSALKTQSPKV